jgi:hypothetical protein
MKENGKTNGHYNGTPHVNGQEKLMPKVKRSFTLPTLDEIPIGYKGCISGDNILRSKHVVWIDRDIVVYPEAYYDSKTMLKVERSLANAGTNAFILTASKVIIKPATIAHAFWPNWYFRWKGYAGPIDFPMLHITNNNWWEASTIESLISSLTAVCYKRTQPVWFQTVLAYTIQRIEEKVLRYEHAIELLASIHGIKALQSLSECLIKVMKEDGIRYKEQFDDDTIRRIIKEFTGATPRFVTESIEDTLNLEKSRIGYTTNSNKQ